MNYKNRTGFPVYTWRKCVMSHNKFFNHKSLKWHTMILNWIHVIKNRKENSLWLKSNQYKKLASNALGTFINDVPRFFAIFDLPTYLVLLYNVPFWGLSWTPYLPKYGKSLMNDPFAVHILRFEILQIK